MNYLGTVLYTGKLKGFLDLYKRVVRLFGDRKTDNDAAKQEMLSMQVYPKNLTIWFYPPFK